MFQSTRPSRWARHTLVYGQLRSRKHIRTSLAHSTLWSHCTCTRLGLCTLRSRSCCTPAHCNSVQSILHASNTCCY
jgi:hypothetical protein